MLSDHPPPRKRAPIVQHNCYFSVLIVQIFCFRVAKDFTGKNETEIAMSDRPSKCLIKGLRAQSSFRQGFLGT